MPINKIDTQILSLCLVFFQRNGVMRVKCAENICKKDQFDALLSDQN